MKLLLGVKPKELPSKLKEEWDKTKSMLTPQDLSEQYKILKLSGSKLAQDIPDKPEKERIILGYPNEESTTEEIKTVYDDFFNEMRNKKHELSYQAYLELKEMTKHKAQKEGWVVPISYSDFLREIKELPKNREIVKKGKLPNFDLEDLKEYSKQKEVKHSLNDNELIKNPMDPEISDNERKGMFDWLKDKGWIDTDWSNFEAMFSGKPFYYKINWHGNKSDLRRVLMWVHGNKKKWEDRNWIPYNNFGKECFSNVFIKDDDKFPTSVTPFSGPKKKELDEFISKYNSF